MVVFSALHRFGYVDRFGDTRSVPAYERYFIGAAEDGDAVGAGGEAVAQAGPTDRVVVPAGTYTLSAGPIVLPANFIQSARETGIATDVVRGFPRTTSPLTA